MNRSLFPLCKIVLAGSALLIGSWTPVCAAAPPAPAAAPESAPDPDAPARATAPAPPAPETLPSGATLILRPDRLAPRVAISVLVRAGAADETPDTSGWRRLLSEAMLQGAQHGNTVLNDRTLASAAEALGGRIGMTVADDSVEVFITGGSEHTRELAQLALDVALHPRLSDTDITAARRKAVQNAQSARESVATRAVQSLEGQLFRDARGEVTAYGLASGGTEQSLSAVSSEKLRLLHAQYFRPSRLVIGAAGDVDPAALREVFGAGEENVPQDTGARPVFARPAASSPPLVVRQLPSDSAWVVVGFAGAGVSAPDSAALRVAVAALAESRTARLPARLLRSDPLGILHDAPSVTEVEGQWTPRRYASEVALFAQTGPQSIEATKNALLDEVRRLREGGLSAGELEAAKAYARGSFATDNESLRDRAFTAALWSLIGANSEADWSNRLARVTAADVRRASIKYLQTYAVALIMPAEDDSGDDGN